MPEVSDNLPDFLAADRRASLRELFLHDITIVSCRAWKNSPPWQVARRRCHDTFLLFPFEGRVRVSLSGRSLTVAPGHFLILPEDTPHALSLVAGHRRLWQIALHCHLEDRWKRSLMTRFPTVLGTLGDPKETKLQLSELACLMTRDPDTAQAYGAALVQNLLAHELRRRPLIGDVQPGGDHRVGLALRRMETDLSSPNLSVEELARSVDLTPVQFRKLFLRDIGESPKQFLQQLRMRRALWLLSHTTAPVKDIAAQCGFATDHYFHLSFHKRFGKTPTQYRTGPASQV